MAPPPARSGILSITLWCLAWLALLDIAVNAVFGTDQPLDEAPALARYFEYGRSIEGKLERQVAADPNRGGQMISTAWIEEDWLRSLPSAPEGDDDLLVAVYGQSFSHIATHEAARVDGRITVRAVGGPGAPPSHSYAAYQADVGLRRADVVVLGILSWAVPNMGSLSGLLWNFESPAPFTFPRYGVAQGQLTAVEPLIRSEAQFRAAFTARDETWQRFEQQLREHDRGYSALTFDASWADHSAIARMLRRGWVAHARPYEQGVFDPAEGFDPRSQEIQALRALLAELARDTRARGERLVVLLLHSQGHADHLDRALAETLQAHRIEYISTHTLFSSADPSNYKFDGHYSDAANARLGASLLAALRRAPAERHAAVADSSRQEPGAPCPPSRPSCSTSHRTTLGTAGPTPAPPSR